MDLLHLRQDLLVIRLQRPANCTGPPQDNTLNRGSKLKYPTEKTHQTASLKLSIIYQRLKWTAPGQGQALNLQHW